MPIRSADPRRCASSTAAGTSSASRASPSRRSRTAAFSTRFKQLNIESRQNTPEDFARFVEEQMKLWSGVVKEANIKLG